MSDENPQAGFFSKFGAMSQCRKTKCAVTGFLVFGLLMACGVAYYRWFYMPQTVMESSTPAMPVSQPLSMAPAAPEMNGQALLAQQLQKVQSASIPVAEANNLFLNLNNQVAVIQILLANQQFPAALNFLMALENDLALLPTDAQKTLQAAIEVDRENIQKTQEVIGQLTGQLQQLEHYLNQQLLARLNQEGATINTQNNNIETANLSFFAKIWNSIKNEISSAVHVENKSENNLNEPNFYTAIMLQLALQKAEFALEQGNWSEYQLTLTSLQTWVTTNLLTWLPDAPGMIKTLTELTQQPSPFANANINNTQHTLNNLMQESMP